MAVMRKKVFLCPSCSADRIERLFDDTILCINCSMEWTSLADYERACTAKKMGGGRVVAGEEYLVGDGDGSLKQDLDGLVKAVANDTYQKMVSVIDLSIDARTRIIEETDNETQRVQSQIQLDVLQKMKTWALANLESLDNE